MIKIYAVSIERFAERNSYIRKELEDKTQLPWEILGIDAEIARSEAGWDEHSSSMRDSEIGCALSHAEACIKASKGHHEFAFIIEDDVSLPDNIDEILESLCPHVKEGEVVALYSRTLRPEKFSTVRAEPVLDMMLIYPLETRFIRTGAAYFVRRETAGRIAAANCPVRFPADAWANYYQSGSINQIRLLHPIPVSLFPFASTLAVDRGSPFERAVKKLIKRFPPAMRLRELRRRLIERRRERNVVLVDFPADQSRAQFNASER